MLVWECLYSELSKMHDILNTFHKSHYSDYHWSKCISLTIYLGCYITADRHQVTINDNPTEKCFGRIFYIWLHRSAILVLMEDQIHYSTPEQWQASGSDLMFITALVVARSLLKLVLPVKSATHLRWPTFSRQNSFLSHSNSTTNKKTISWGL